MVDQGVEGDVCCKAVVGQLVLKQLVAVSSVWQPNLMVLVKPSRTNQVLTKYNKKGIVSIIPTLGSQSNIANGLVPLREDHSPYPTGLDDLSQQI